MPDYSGNIAEAFHNYGSHLIQMHQVAMQDQEMQMRKQQLADEHDQHLQAAQQALAQMLSGGAKTVNPAGQVSLPNNPEANPMVGILPNASASLPSSGTTMVPSAPGRTVTMAGQKLEVPTQDEQFQGQLAREGQAQTQKDQLEMKHALDMRNATYSQLPDQITTSLGLPQGMKVDPSKLVEFENAATNRQKLTEDREAPDRQALNTASLRIAKARGIAVDPNKPVIAQIPLDDRTAAFQMAKEMNSDPEVRASTLATQASARATQESARATQASTREAAAARLDEAKLRVQNLRDETKQLSPKGETQMQEIDNVSKQFDGLLDKLEKYKKDKNPLTLKGAITMYKLGIPSEEGTLGKSLSDLSLGSIQGMMPFASKSRNYEFIKDISQHLPKTNVGLTEMPDSPALAYDKLTNASRNFLRMKASTMKYETKRASTSPTNPTLGDQDAMKYLKMAGGDPKKATVMAIKDGWDIPQ